MRSRRNPWVLVYLPAGLLLLLTAVAGVFWSTRLDDLIPIVLMGVPGLVLVVRVPLFRVSFGPAGLRYTGLLRSRSYSWPEIREVRYVSGGELFSSHTAELVLVSGGVDQLPMAGSYSLRTRPVKRIERLVAELEDARASATTA
ncbi:PH domain-containing protein [Kitasatospora sp. NPDC004240]